MLSSFTIPEPNCHFLSHNSQTVGAGDPPRDRVGEGQELCHSIALGHQLLMSGKAREQNPNDRASDKEEEKGIRKERIQGHRMRVRRGAQEGGGRKQSGAG